MLSVPSSFGSLVRRFGRHTARAVTALCVVAGASWASESVWLEVTQSQSKEQDPLNAYGEIKIRRAAAISTPLAVRFSYVPSVLSVNPPTIFEPTALPLSINSLDATQTWDFALLYTDQFGVPKAHLDATRTSTILPLSVTMTGGRPVYTTFSAPLLGASDFTSPTVCQITIPAGQQSVSVRVQAYRDVDRLFGELAEKVDFNILQDNNFGNTYTITGQSFGQVSIIDANITAAIKTTNECKEPSVTGGGPGGGGNPSGVIRVWFQNSDSRGDFSPGTTFSFSPYSFVRSLTSGLIDRQVEVQLDAASKPGNARQPATLNVDYNMFWHIGGGACLNGSVPQGNLPQEPVDQPFAYRTASETGLDTLGYNPTVTVAGAASFARLSVTGFTLPETYYNLRVVSIAGAAQAASVLTRQYGGKALNDEAAWSIDFNGDGDLLDNVGATAPFVTANPILQVVQNGTRTIIQLEVPHIPVGGGLRNQAAIVLAYETLATTTTVNPGPPPVTTRAQIPTTVTLNLKIDENIIYPTGTVAVSVRTAGSLPPALIVGDVFQFSNDPNNYYRVTGPTPFPNQGSAVNADLNPSAITSVGVSNQSGSFITFWPYLKTPLTRDDGAIRIVNEFPANFDADNKLVISVPGLPVLGAGFGYSGAGTTTTLAYPNGTYFRNDMPNGDWVEFRVQPMQDTEVEGAEEVTLRLVSDGAANGYTVLNPGTATVVLSDTNSVASFDNLVVNASEPSKSGRYRVNFTRAFPKDIEVKYALLSSGLNPRANWSKDTPTVGQEMDFNLTGLDETTGQGSVTLPAGQTSVDIVVSPVSDAIFEDPPENIRIQLLPSADYVLAPNTSTSSDANSATMAIYDTIGTIDLSGPTPNVSYEDIQPFDKTATWTLTLTRRPEPAYQLPVTINYRWSGTALKAVDYTTAGGTEIAYDGTITFAAGETTKQITLLPINDLVTEGDETATLTILPGDTYSLGSNLSGTVTIKDGKSPAKIGTVTLLGPSPITVYEQDTDVTHRPVFSLSLARTLGFETTPITVSYQYGGTSTILADYVPTGGTDVGTQGTITFGPNETVKTITIAPVSDSVAEGDETVSLTILDGGGYTVGSTFTNLATIKDGTPPAPAGKMNITLSSPGFIYEVPLTVGATQQYTVTFTRNPGFETEAVTAVLRLTGTAVPGLDYSLGGDVGVTVGSTSVTILFGATETVKHITLTPIADAVSEGDERATLTINSDQRYVLGTQTSQSVIIKDGKENDAIVVPDQPGISDGQSSGGCGSGSGIAMLLGLGLGFAFLRRTRQNAA